MINLLDNKTFIALTKHYAGLIQKIIAEAPPELLMPGTTGQPQPTPQFAAEIIHAMLEQFQKDFSRCVLLRLAVGGTVRDAVLHAQKDFGIELEENSEHTIIQLMEKSFADEKRKKEEGGIQVDIVPEKK